jgi:hypothetical protein
MRTSLSILQVHSETQYNDAGGYLLGFGAVSWASKA